MANCLCDTFIVLETENPFYKKHAMDVLITLCTYSLEGHEAVIDALDNYKVLFKRIKTSLRSGA